MTYEEVREDFEYSTWERGPCFRGVCFQPEKNYHNNFLVFFNDEERKINVSVYGQECCYYLNVEIDPKECKKMGAYTEFRLRNFLIKLPPDVDRIERERETAYFKSIKQTC